MMKPGEVVKVAFDVGWISQIFNKGHRIRVTVASTGAPSCPSASCPTYVVCFSPEPALQNPDWPTVYHVTEEKARRVLHLCSTSAENNKSRAE
jgi:predicted acyl esterase